MHKKLTTIILAVLIILIGKVEAATLTQKIGEGQIKTTVTAGQQVNLTFASQTNYEFESWTVETGNVTINTTNPTVTFTMPSTDVTIRVNYKTISNYTITYNANGGTGTIASQEVFPGNAIILNNNAYTKSGYTFKGWSEDSTATSATYVNGQMIKPTANMTLYAVWQEGTTSVTQYTITYNANGGTGTMASQTVTVGSTVTLTTNTFTYDGYTFKGWSEDSSATSATYTDGQTITPTANMTLYAVWQEEAATGYTLTYDANGGSGAPEAQTGTTLTISSTIPTRDGYICVGWALNSSYSTPSYTAGDSITLTANKKLYAVWEIAYTLTYNANGGSGAPTTQMGENLILSTTVPTAPSGKAFRGWSTSSTDTIADYKIGGHITLTADTTLYAVYVTPLASGAKFTGADVGAYVTYTPTKTSYSPSYTGYSVYSSETGSSTYPTQTFDPSSATSWRVFSNDGTTVEIISDESVGTLYLGSKTGYQYAVKTLQDMSAAYVNSTYATSTRSLGYSEEGLTEDQITNYKKINTTTYPIEYIETVDFPYIDSQYSLSGDFTIIRNNGLLKHTQGDIWIASRYAWASDDRTYFAIRTCSIKGSIGYDTTISEWYPVSGSAGNYSNGVRPIITLKSGLEVSGGNGSPNNPYTLSVPSTYTLTYNANGGSGAPAAQTGTTLTISSTQPTPPTGKAFRGWSTSSSATVAEYKVGASISVSSLGDTTLYAVYETPLSVGDSIAQADVGAYVTYTPSSTSYTVSTTVSGYTSGQTYNPSSTTSWRVFSTDGTTVEVISDESVGTLYLKAVTGYINAVETLQDISSSYINSTYATSTRSLGYSEEGLTDVDNYKKIITDTYPVQYGATSTFPYSDSQSSNDVSIL